MNLRRMTLTAPPFSTGFSPNCGSISSSTGNLLFFLRKRKVSKIKMKYRGTPHWACLDRTLLEKAWQNSGLVWLSFYGKREVFAASTSNKSAKEKRSVALYGGVAPIPPCTAVCGSLWLATLDKLWYGRTDTYGQLRG